jgi:outer membrane protein OmpA-like peptidoglycan-associated protein
MANVRVPQSTRTGAVPVGNRRRRPPLWLWLLLGLLALLLLAWLLYALLHDSSGKKSSTPSAATSAAASTTGKSASTPSSVTGGTPAAGPSTAPSAVSSGSSGGAAPTTNGAALVGGGGIAATTASGSAGAEATQGTVLFASGSSKVDAAGLQVIRAAAVRIKALRAGAVTVVGYTDLVGGQPKNDNLSAQRAAAVAAALRAELGVALPVTTSAKGEADPVAPNTTAIGRQQNRRAVITSS